MLSWSPSSVYLGGEYGGGCSMCDGMAENKYKSDTCCECFNDKLMMKLKMFISQESFIERSVQQILLSINVEF